MNWAVKLGVIAVVLVAITILLYAAVSDSIFFNVHQLTSDDVVHDEGNGYALPFFKNGKAIEVAALPYDISKTGSDSATITFQISHKIDYKMDSLNLRFKMLQPPSALVLENTENYSPPPLIYIPVDDNSSIVFDFSDPEGTEGSVFRTFNLNFSLNLLEIDPLFTDQLILDINFAMHEESIFRILQYTGQIAVQLDISSNTQ
jgi:hypothetical protein